MALYSIPKLSLSSGRKIPVLGLGTATFPPEQPEKVIQAVVEAIKLGIRHFDTAAVYQSEGDLGEAISEALSLGLIKSRDELFITSKLWCSDAHADLVIPALQKTLANLKLDYLDLYLIHWPVSMKPGSMEYPPNKGDVLALDIKAVWQGMEECQVLGLTKSIGVSNFSTKKLGEVLALAKIPPSVNQDSFSSSYARVMVNPLWQQKKMIEFCKPNGVIVEGFSPLGAVGTSWGANLVMENSVLKEIANAKRKSVAQICLRWAYEQGVVVVFKSYNKERMKQNLDIFEWELSDEESKKISEIPQSRLNSGDEFISEDGPIKSLEQLWDGEL